MADALIGHTGFVGGNLLRQRAFDACYNSQNVAEIRGRGFDLLVVSAMPAAKWLANRDPDRDRAVLERLLGDLRQVQARRVVLVSTVDVYPRPVAVDETTPLDVAQHHAYGKHRRMLEEAAVTIFPQLCVVRLPALFGPGLKKNAVYDLMHDNEVHKIPSAGEFQFYNLDRLWADVETALRHDLKLVNFAAAPTTMADVARRVFDREFTNDPGGTPPRYDVRTIHAAKFGGRDGYLYDRETVLAEMAAFVRREREQATL